MPDEKPANWWTTLPGLLTAAAAVITAVTGLLLGLGQLGVFDGGRPAAPVSGPSTAGAPQHGGTPQPGGSRSGDGANAGWTVALPAERKYRSVDVEYEILDAAVRPDASGKVALSFTIRCTNHGRYDINFWDSTFRLGAGGVNYSPDSGLNELVAGDSSKSGDVRFIVPADTRDVSLRIKYAQGESAAQLAISPP
ncbi:hypothetical protein [Arthrobacter sp. ISL-72]|uniref:hypothetical protein n=1 Tax=Arthrobacter sp. ISL-72 TaxID=2819114 RepID=UPI001BE8490A|nr:hypothetical protein [Arthrobacter sp. ISL-72]MBT2594839.1 hypothetical protein [Arthrobacter sp. ISL-72]